MRQVCTYVADKIQHLTTGGAKIIRVLKKKKIDSVLRRVETISAIPPAASRGC